MPVIPHKLSRVRSQSCEISGKGLGCKEVLAARSMYVTSNFHELIRKPEPSSRKPANEQTNT